MSNDKLTEVILKDGDVVHFTTKTSNYGIAGFTVCLIVKRGKLKEMIISPIQQPNAQHTYRIPTGSHCTSWSVESWIHKNISAPRCWVMGWCKEHKCMFMNISVPPESNCFEVMLGSTASIYFNNQPKKERLDPK